MRGGRRREVTQESIDAILTAVDVLGDMLSKHRIMIQLMKNVPLPFNRIIKIDIGWRVR